MLRYKTAAECCFQRECRQLEQRYKAHQTAPPEPTPEEKAEAEAANYCPVDFTVEDPTRPTDRVLGLRSGGNPELDKKLAAKSTNAATLPVTGFVFCLRYSVFSSPGSPIA